MLNLFNKLFNSKLFNNKLCNNKLCNNKLCNNKLFNNKYNKWIYIIASALIYPIPFIFSYYSLYLWPLTFIFLVPIFFITLNNYNQPYKTSYNISFKDGFVWGLITFSIHELGIYYSLINMAEDNKLFILLILALLSIYQAVYSGLWFFITNLLIKITKTENTLLKLIFWIITTWIYFYFIQNYLLWPFDVTEGYFLVHPLLPLANIPKLLYLMPIISKSALTLILIITSALITLLFFTKNFFTQIILLILIITPWLLSIILSLISSKSDNHTPKWLSQIGCIKESFYNPNNPKKTVQEITKKIKLLLKKHPEINIILFPESAFYLCDLYNIPKLLKLWDKKHLSKPVHIFIGGLKKENNRSYNTIFWIYDGKIKDRFNKKHSMILTERIPSWLSTESLQKSYYKDRPIITPSSNNRPTFNISKSIKLVPYICSEIFFKDKPDYNFNYNSKNITLTSFCNDSWIFPILSQSYLKHLMLLTNRFKAIEWSRNIIYISFTNCYFVAKSGNKIKLLT